MVFPLEEVKKHSINKILYPNNMNNTSNMNNLSMPMMNQFSNTNNMMMNGFNNNMMMNISNNNMFNNMMVPFNNMNNFYGMNNNIFINNMNMAPMMNQSFQINQMNMLVMQNNMGLFPNMNNQINNTNNINNINMNMNMINDNDRIKLQKLNTNIVSLEDCFIYNEKIEFFKDSNQIYCNNCHQMANAQYFSTLTNCPKILILLLNRGVGIQFKIKLEFSTIIDISKYVAFDNKSRQYKLIGVITHLGESGASGHFIAHCLSPVDGKWYTYNDEIVSECDNFQKNIIDLGMPYLLFYQRID